MKKVASFALFVVGFGTTYYLMTGTGGFRAGRPTFGLPIDGEWVKLIVSFIVGKILPEFLPQIWKYIEPFVSGLQQDKTSEQLILLQTGLAELKTQFADHDKFVRESLGPVPADK